MSGEGDVGNDVANGVVPPESCRRQWIQWRRRWWQLGQPRGARGMIPGEKEQGRQGV